MEDLLKRLKGIKTEFRRAEKAEKELANEICSFITGRTFEYRKIKGDEPTYIRVKSARPTKYGSIEMNADVVLFEFASIGSKELLGVHHAIRLGYYDRIYTGDFFDHFKEIPKEEFEAKYSVWTKIVEMVNDVMNGTTPQTIDL